MKEEGKRKTKRKDGNQDEEKGTAGMNAYIRNCYSPITPILVIYKTYKILINNY
jgi:hypothetical protein